MSKVFICNQITCIVLPLNIVFLLLTVVFFPKFNHLQSFEGLHDNLHEGRFKWFDGLRFQHGVCVPVHADGGHLENCVAWSIEKPEGCWEDRRCTEKIPFTCRIPIEGNEIQ